MSQMQSEYIRRLELIVAGLDRAIWGETEIESRIGPEATTKSTMHLTRAMGEVQRALHTIRRLTAPEAQP